MSLAGKTLFITGASRGIGLAIALRAARDGANVIIGAKTVEAHPKLPGTIYTAAEEVKAAGGKCLPCLVDVRDEASVQSAVEQGAKEFGGIDILINNASAISLTGTLETPMKRYDLMHQVNIRGTYLASQKCIPYLEKSSNPHILNISPPLNMNKIWFKNHVAYTMAKYGMSMCVLGMAEELKSKGIAVNAIWPRTGIWTAALAMLGGGDEEGGFKNHSRTPEIMADAAHAMLVRDAKKYTGNFAIDDEVLAEEGVTNFDKYAVAPGNPLMPDFFLGDKPFDGTFEEEGKLSTPKATEASSSAPASGEIGGLFQQIEKFLAPELVEKTKACYQFEVSGPNEGVWFIDLSSGAGSCGPGPAPNGKPDVTFKMKDVDFVAMFKGQLKPANAFFTGKLKMEGPMNLALKLDKVLGKLHHPAKL